MRAVIQRVASAAVSVGGSETARIGRGFLILLGVERGDSEEEAEWLCKKVVGLRVFDDEAGVMNRSITEVDGDILVVSQFTLLASYRKGNRPSYTRAAGHEEAIPLYEGFCSRIGELTGKQVGRGVFGADMKVELVNDGPVTICMDTRNRE